MTEPKNNDSVDDKSSGVEIKVNKKPVLMPSHKATGLQIKEEAKKQGVAIDLDFVLSRRLESGETTVIQNDKTVELHKDEHFVAIAGDDNSTLN